MAIAIDVLNLGETLADSAGSTVAVTTTSAAAAGSTIILVGCAFKTTTINASSVAGGGLSWAVDKTAYSSGNDNVFIASAYAAAGLASSTALTVTFSASAAGARAVYATSFTGIATTSPVDTTSGPTDYTGTAWTSASTAIAAGSVLIAVCNDFFTSNVATVTAPSIQSHNSSVGGSFTLVSGYRIEASSGSYVVAGTYDSASADGTVVAVAYKVAPPAGVPIAWITA